MGKEETRNSLKIHCPEITILAFGEQNAPVRTQAASFKNDPVLQIFHDFRLSFCLIAEPGHTDSQGLTCGEQTPQSQTGLGSEIHRAGVSMGSKRKTTMGRYLEGNEMTVQ